MSQFAEEVIAEHGQVDILINDTGITLTPTVFEDISDAQFNKVIDVNMWGFITVSGCFYNICEPGQKQRLSIYRVWLDWLDYMVTVPMR